MQSSRSKPGPAIASVLALRHNGMMNENNTVELLSVRTKEFFKYAPRVVELIIFYRLNY